MSENSNDNYQVNVTDKLNSTYNPNNLGASHDVSIGNTRERALRMDTADPELKSIQTEKPGFIGRLINKIRNRGERSKPVDDQESAQARLDEEVVKRVTGSIVDRINNQRNFTDIQDFYNNPDKSLDAEKSKLSEQQRALALTIITETAKNKLDQLEYQLKVEAERPILQAQTLESLYLAIGRSPDHSDPLGNNEPSNFVRQAITIKLMDEGGKANKFDSFTISDISDKVTKTFEMQRRALVNSKK